ncbi:Fascin-like incomplete domain containing protein [Pandoravirus quercus]|uniref:Fascin-like incomplete domain containing protein n=1 Tax=Pandoravirus quercus TaxID=2107709 RepID=A0A2U7UA74_9VIRU|nr:Fascin-like incomplete domain containing protein [Pandoravirus quercus]AVK75292.1 Fascin-like incomplete domain containing protein [Pandoravirus quercus]
MQHIYTAIFLVACCLAVPPTETYRHSVVITESQILALPAGSTNVSVTLWGGGGGSSTSRQCGASGGSGAAVIGRSTNSQTWATPVDAVEWTLTVGGGGAGLPATEDTSYTGGTAGNGGASVVVARAPNGTELFRATAHGGGGAKSVPWGNSSPCRGGGGGGATSSADGPTPGGGTPSGGVDNNPVGPPTEGAMVGDVKAGGAGAGCGFVGGNSMQPFVRGADWNSPGRSWAGGDGSITTACFGWGGAAGFNGDGGLRQDYMARFPAANSGSGGGSAMRCVTSIGSTKYYADVAGAAGGIVIDYDNPMAPTPSPSPSPASPSPTRSPTPSRTPSPSVTPSPTAQPLSQLVTLVSPISGKQLTPQDDGSVKSLWYGASYKEKWTVSRLASGKYTFRGFNGKYLGANPGGWVRAEATAVGAWEEWDVLINAGNQWTLKSAHGTYMGTTAAGVVYLNSDSTLYWTKTTV